MKDAPAGSAYAPGASPDLAVRPRALRDRSEKRVFAVYFGLFLSTTIANIAFFPSVFNFVVTGAAAVFACFLLLSQPMSARAVLTALLTVSLLAVHLALTSPTSQDTRRGEEQLLRLAAIVLPLVVLAWRTGRRGHFSSLTDAYLAAAALSAPVLVFFSGSVEQHYISGGRLVGGAIPLAVFHPQLSARNRTLLSALLLVGAGASGSRQALLGAGLSCGLIAWVGLRQAWRTGSLIRYFARSIALGLVLSTGFVTAIALLGRTSDSRLEFLLARQLETLEGDPFADASLQARVATKVVPALERASDNIFGGLGIGASSLSDGPYAYPHNIVLELFLSFGLLGLAFGLFLCGRTLGLARRLASHPESRGLAGFILAWLFFVQVSGAIVINRGFYIALAAGVGAETFLRQREPSR